jgi:hypothetical protein
MIFEMRTYLMKPGSIPRVEELFGAGLPARAKLSRFGGFWRSEVGTLNQIIHVWPYKDLAEREHIRAEAIRTGIWPVKIQDDILEMESKILHAAPFSPAIPRSARSTNGSMSGPTRTWPTARRGAPRR